MSGKLRFVRKVGACVIITMLSLTGCGTAGNNKVTEIEIVQYKPEAANFFKNVEKKFNETHSDIHLTINSPNDASTILRTRFIREDYPDIIGIGGDINYSYYVDANILADISDYDGLKNVNPAYKNIDKGLEIVPKDGAYALPYVANAAGVLYNKEMFEKYGWKIPQTWDEFTALCDKIKAEGILPMYLGFKDTWTCLAPWNSMAVDLADGSTPKLVNKGEATFTDAYREVADKYLKLLDYGPKDPFAYGYNDACTAFANGEAAMYPIGSYAVPQILSVNPELKIDSFVMPANDDATKNTLNSGIDLQFCVAADCKNKQAAYEVLDFLSSDENVQEYIDNQMAIPCKQGSFKLPSILDGMESYIDSGNMTDYQDHYYPSEMAVDAQLQSYLIDKDTDAFLKKFDSDWIRYNRDIIREMKEYEEGKK